jgi:hypothetical protein
MITKQGVSLRQVARTLNYAVSTLHEGREAGHFEALEDGSYSIQDVARGLLDNSSPRADRRALLEAIAASADTPKQPPPSALLDPRTERAIAASTRLSTTPEVMDAIDLLARLAGAKAQAFHAIVPLADPVGAKKVFAEAIVEMLFERIKQLNEGEDDETETCDDLVDAIGAAAVADKKQLERS